MNWEPAFPVEAAKYGPNTLRYLVVAENGKGAIDTDNESLAYRISMVLNEQGADQSCKPWTVIDTRESK